MAKKYSLDFDALRKEEEATFVLSGKKYVIPIITYDLLVKMTGLDKDLNAAIEDDDVQKVIEKSIEIACLVVDDLDEKMLREQASISEIHRIGELINKTMVDTEQNPEVAFYREKYEDEYRKNFQRTKEEKK